MSCSPGSPWPTMGCVPRQPSTWDRPVLLAFVSRRRFPPVCVCARERKRPWPRQERRTPRAAAPLEGPAQQRRRLENRSDDDNDEMISQCSHFNEIESRTDSERTRRRRLRRLRRRRKRRLGGRSEEKRQIGAPRAARLGRD